MLANFRITECIAEGKRVRVSISGYPDIVLNDSDIITIQEEKIPESSSDASVNIGGDGPSL